METTMGLSENSVPINHPMGLLIIIPNKWLFHWGYTSFSDIPTWNHHGNSGKPIELIRFAMGHQLGKAPGNRLRHVPLRLDAEGQLYRQGPRGFGRDTRPGKTKSLLGRITISNRQINDFYGPFWIAMLVYWRVDNHIRVMWVLILYTWYYYN